MGFHALLYGSSSVVEHWSPKPAVGSSNLSFRAKYYENETNKLS